MTPASPDIHAMAWSMWPLLVGLLACAVALGFALRAGWRVHRCQSLAALRRDQRGTATMEFVLVFPIVLGLVLVLIQTTLVMAGNYFVHYAAFAATRSATTTIPADRPTWSVEPRNQITLSRGSGKFDRIRSAAVLALLPVSGERAGGADRDAAALESGLTSYYQAHGASAPRWVRTKAGARLRYADRHTGIEMLGVEVGEGEVSFARLSGIHVFGPHDPVTVRVAHRLNLSVPYARAIFADGSHEAGEGAYANVAAQYTLTNAGVDPSLPPAPALPRQDRHEAGLDGGPVP
ncbi:MAG: TadE/TadG family type IV pilus assembly protein [Phycisphaeraceae bacterium]